MLVGKPAGTLETIRHVVFGAKTPVSNLSAEILVRTGVQTAKFGENMTGQHRQCDGRLPGLAG